MTSPTPAPPVRRRRRLATLLVGAAILVGGCATLADLAPPVGDEARRAAESSGIAIDRVERGRAIYITACARCHSPEPVLRYSAAKWAEILPRMVERCHLDAADAADVGQYVQVTLRADEIRADAISMP